MIDKNIKCIVMNKQEEWIQNKKFERWVIIEGARAYEEQEEKYVSNKKKGNNRQSNFIKDMDIQNN